ncbi:MULTISPECIES: MarR family winged helix-turn-helix transcriptional regulator [Brucella]|jgi:MarR family transcriptional regulator for hemolysin|uniref:MarR family transcriptional regulator n=2 Tax=Brucella pseudogrignonensis TaxID=419475 RepID=A0A7Y3T1G4_9HYPH|nr:MULTISPECIES: MarR family transcriptional regulator [Brucella]MBO1025323.1 MarR family transcriptional regulator [Ochrobactrum sp. SD129]MQP41243.1 MarR family transcriptional regulator [Ochrobactrum sp. MYb237]ANG97245.1 MarR family transcriptional regulator [Brucella pseudogrignonensis]NNV19297.1 MarR family transcriptional regulator [Brucella pseudogrignonensis]PQZ40367.1 MarR family transcriptional regulator [Brucella pseudogrignonensis]
MSQSKLELEAAFTMGLSTAARKMRNLFDSRVRERGLTLARARVLLLLAEQRDWNQRELADALEIEHPSVVRLLDGLEKQQLIYRAAVEGDRRAKRIELTEEAQAQVKQLQEITQAIRAELLQKIDQKSLETALTVLQEISQTVEATLADKDR